MTKKQSTSNKSVKRSINLDGWANIITGLGQQSRDKRLSTKYQPTALLSDEVLTNLYISDGLATRVIDLPTRDMTRRWFTVEGDTENAVASYLEREGAKAAVIELVRWARLYGGAILVMGVNDGGELEEPVNENKIESIDFFNVFDKTCVSPSIEYYTNPAESKYGLPKIYQVSPLHGGAQFLVHETRVLRMIGKPMPMRLARQNNGWGMSVLQPAYEALREIGVGFGSSAQLMDDFVQTVLKITGLADILASGKDDLIIKRAQILALSRSVANIIVTDKEEEYTKQTTNVTGLPEILREFIMQLCSITGIPYTLLRGESPAGLKATGDSDIRFYYDNIASDQSDVLRPVLNNLVKYTMLAQKGPTKGKLLDNWRIDFLPLWQPTQQEIVDLRAKQATIDDAYIAANVLSPNEVRASRFGGQQYSIETTVEGDAPEVEDGDDDDDEVTK